MAWLRLSSLFFLLCFLVACRKNNAALADYVFPSDYTQWQWTSSSFAASTQTPPAGDKVVLGLGPDSVYILACNAEVLDSGLYSMDGYTLGSLLFSNSYTRTPYPSLGFELSPVNGFSYLGGGDTLLLIPSPVSPAGIGQEFKKLN
jgi:hypothetical protein